MRLANWRKPGPALLPEVEESSTHSFSGEELADRYGAEEVDQKPDLPTPADTAGSPAP